MTPPAPTLAPRRYWHRWTLATVVGEIVGLGGAGILAGLAALLVPEDPGVVLVVALTALMLATGAGEGAVVGFAQSRVLRHAVPAIRPRRWMAATAAGALLAWALGASVLISLPDDAAFEDYLPLMVVLGAACGTLLGLAQWVVLREAVGRARWWVAANTAGWALGLLIAFSVPMAISETTPFALVVLLALLTGAGTGISPGLVTGLVLDRLLGAGGGQADGQQDGAPAGAP